MIYDLSLHCLKVQHWVEFFSNLYDSFSDSFLPSPLPCPATASFKHTSDEEDKNVANLHN